MLDELFFLIRYTPFWSIPIALIAGELGYIFWLRKKKKVVWVSLSIAFICLFCMGFYFWCGGPERTVAIVREFIHYHFQ